MGRLVLDVIRWQRLQQIIHLLEKRLQKVVRRGEGEGGEEGGGEGEEGGRTIKGLNRRLMR